MRKKCSPYILLMALCLLSQKVTFCGMPKWRTWLCRKYQQYSVFDITVSDSCSIFLSVCVNVSVQVQSSNVTCPQFDPSVFNVTTSENTPSQTIVLNGTLLQGDFSNTSGATIRFVLCANPMYGNNLALNKPVGMLYCPLEENEPQLTSSPFQALLECVKLPPLKLQVIATVVYWCAFVLIYKVHA